MSTSGEGWDEASGPGLTALGLAAARTVETGRADRLIDDPLARTLYLSAAVDLPMRLDWPAPQETLTPPEALHLHGSRYIGLRTRVYDDFLLEHAHAGCPQAVLLGAGLDTRAFRLPLPPSTRLLEVDQPAVLGYKRRVLAGQHVRPTCRHAMLGADLRAPGWPSTLSDLDPEAPTVWIAEGLLAYLTPSEQLDLLDAITGLSTPGSRLAFDRLLGNPQADSRAAALTERSGLDMQSMLAGGEPPELLAALEERGWEATVSPVADQAARYSRDLSDPFAEGDPAAQPPWLDTEFVFAHRVRCSS